MKRVAVRCISSFCVGVVVAVLISTAMVIAVGRDDFIPLVPSYLACFSNVWLAFNVYYLLVGVISGVFGACSVIFELERWSYRKQGIVHFILTSAVWFPIAVFLWGLFHYPAAVRNTFISMAVTYGIIWYMQYRSCKKSIGEINEKLQQLQEQEEHRQ